MAQNGVTKGCDPPTNTEYCPGEFVTREQMAAFMHRLESEGVFLRTDGRARDADKLDGKDASAFLGVDAQAADADLLDGRNSTFYRLRCSDGRLLHLGMCFERGPRDPMSQFNATLDCADEAMRLASPGELAALREIVLTGTEDLAMAAFEWTDDRAGFEPPYFRVVGTSGSTAVVNGNDDLPYRCVGGPVG